MYRSILEDNEREILSDECEFIHPKDNVKKSGMLILSNHYRIIFITKNGRQYNIDHEYLVDEIDRAKVVLADKFLGKKFVLSIKLIDSKSDDGTRFYDNFKNTMPGRWVDAISDSHSQNKQRCFELLIGILKSHEKTSFDEIYEICKGPFYLDAYLKEGVSKETIDNKIEEIVIELISSNKVEGFINRNNREFIHKVAYQQKTEIVQYQVATNFEFGKDGTMSLKCPNCGASKPFKEKSNEVKCSHCDSTYVVPKKILDLM